MHIISNIALITINETLVVQMVSFLIFLFLINRIMVRPLKQTMDDRDRYIEQLQNDIKDSSIQLNALTDQIKAEEIAVRAEAMALFREMEALGNEQADEIFSSAKKEVDAQIESVQVAIDAQLAEMNKDLKAESELIAVQIMEKLLDRKLTQ